MIKTNKINTINIYICMAIICIMCMAIGISVSTNIAYGETENVEDKDPFYPNRTYGKYTFNVPSLEGRLTTSGNTSTLFAPYTNKNGGWYDVNKKWDIDSNHCWAAACSNVLAWYLDSEEKGGLNYITGYDRDVEAIFSKYRNNWNDDGFDPVNGFNWYFTGQLTSGDKNMVPQLKVKDSGGYLSAVAHGSNDTSWADFGATDDSRYFGNWQDKFPFVDDAEGTYYESGRLYNHEKFSRTIIEQLHYGATVLSVAKESGSAHTSHAVTLWGCDYNTTTGLVTNLYLTDSDDPHHKLIRARVDKRSGDSGGIKLYFYPEGFGDASPFTRVISSTVLFAGGVVSEKITHTCTLVPVEKAATCESDGHVTYYRCTECGKLYEDIDATREILDEDAFVRDNIIPRLGHDYTAPTYTWDGIKCTATMVCTRDASHVVTEEAMAVESVIPSTCTEDGERKYTATFTHSGFSVQVKSEAISALGHNYEKRENDTHTWEECTRCHSIKNKVEKTPPIVDKDEINGQNGENNDSIPPILDEETEGTPNVGEQTDAEKPKFSNTLVIVVSVVTALVALGGLVAVIIVSKRK